MPHKDDHIAYSVSGNYEDPSKAEFHICLPPEGENEYTFTEQVYNISQVYNGNDINAILLLFKDKDNYELSSVNNYILHTYNLNDITDIDNANVEDFKPEAEETLVVFFHDDEHLDWHKNEIFSKVPDWLEEITTNNAGKPIGATLSPAPLQPLTGAPRRVGMSVVKKRVS